MGICPQAWYISPFTGEYNGTHCVLDFSCLLETVKVVSYQSGGQSPSAPASAPLLTPTLDTGGSVPPPSNPDRTYTFRASRPLSTSTGITSLVLAADGEDYSNTFIYDGLNNQSFDGLNNRSHYARVPFTENSIRISRVLSALSLFPPE